MSVISGIETPKHKLVQIKYGDNTSVIDKDLIFDEDLSFKLSSSFGSLWDAHGNNLMTMLSSLTKGKIPSGQFVMQGMQIWQSTDPLSFSLTLKLVTINNAKEDVFIPALTLAQLPLPMKSKNANGVTNSMLATLIPAGPNILKILTEGHFESINDFLAKLNGGTDSKGTYNVNVCGYLEFVSVIITSCNPTFSKYVDESGYPISADVELEFTTCQIATTDMLADMMKTNGNKGV